MKKSEIKIGSAYLAKVTNRVVPVRLTGENTHGGWDAVNTATGKAIRIKSAARLRREATAEEIARDKRKIPMCAAAARAEGAAKAKAALPTPIETKVTTTKPAPKKAKAAKPKRVSLLDAAATVLKSATAPMAAKSIVEEVEARGLWTSGKGKTPHATLYAAMIREIAKKQTDARFKKVERGLFTANGKAA